MKCLASKSFFIISLLFSCIASVEADEVLPIIVNASKPTAVIKLQSNPTTGYSWLLQGYDHRLMNLVSHNLEASKTKHMGAPGMEIWTFKIKPEAFLAPRLIKVNFIYARVWDLKSATEKTVNIITQNTP